MLMKQRISIDTIKNLSPMWFSAENKRFFKSRWSSYAYKFKQLAFFVSSEQFNYNSPRLYTVRAYNIKRKDFVMSDNFQSYETSYSAWKDLKSYLRLLEDRESKKAIRQKVHLVFFTSREGKLNEYRPQEEILVNGG